MNKTKNVRVKVDNSPTFDAYVFVDDDGSLTELNSGGTVRPYFDIIGGIRVASYFNEYDYNYTKFFYCRENDTFVELYDDCEFRDPTVSSVRIITSVDELFALGYDWSWELVE